MPVDHRLGDRQAQPQTAELLGDRRLPLLEGVEDERQRLGADPLARIPHFHLDPTAPGRTGRHPDRPAAGRELGRVLDQVPDHLLEPRRVDVDQVGRRGQVGFDGQSLVVDLAADDVQHVPDQVVEMGRPPLQPQLAADHPAEVQQVVDQAGLQVDVAADHRQVFLHLGGQFLDHLHQADRRDHRGQWGAQLVAEDGEEAVLRQAGRLRHILGLLQLRLGFLPGRDVLDGADDADRPPLSVAFLERHASLAGYPADGPVIPDALVIGLVDAVAVGVHGALDGRWTRGRSSG